MERLTGTYERKLAYEGVQKKEEHREEENRFLTRGGPKRGLGFSYMGGVRDMSLGKIGFAGRGRALTKNAEGRKLTGGGNGGVVHAS